MGAFDDLIPQRQPQRGMFDDLVPQVPQVTPAMPADPQVAVGLPPAPAIPAAPQMLPTPTLTDPGSPEAPIMTVPETQSLRRWSTPSAAEIAEVDHTMALENQRPDAESSRHASERRAWSLVDKRGLWS